MIDPQDLPFVQILTDTEATIIMVVGSIANGTCVMAAGTIINWDH
jgi:hypothetical protein